MIKEVPFIESLVYKTSGATCAEWLIPSTLNENSGSNVVGVLSCTSESTSAGSLVQLLKAITAKAANRVNFFMR